MESEDEIIASLAEGQLWEDPTFTANDLCLYHDLASIPEYANVEPRITHGPHNWLRPQEYTRAPVLFKSGPGAGDVVQGQLADCWLLGAAAAVANHPRNFLSAIIASPDDGSWVKHGVITFQLYRNGEWTPVTIDTRVPYGDPSSDQYNWPVYGRNRDSEEAWLVLLEKAVAKLQGNYQTLNKGSVAETLVDLTGGVSEKFLLTDKHVRAMVEDGSLWERLFQFVQQDYIVCCSMSVYEGGFDSDAGTGLLMNHAYSVLYMKSIGARKFLKIRNPWGHGEWRGDWSDSWAKWDQHPDVESALLDDPAAKFNRNVKDGTFWMEWSDFARHFNKMIVCRVFGEEYNQFLINGRWEGASAAGAHKGNAGAEPADEESKLGAGHTKDGDPQWFLNPQYRITCNKPGTCIISLMQADRRTRGAADNVPIRFVVLRDRRNAKCRAWEEDPAEVVGDSARSAFSSAFPQREVTLSDLELDPKYSYVVVPHTQHAGIEMNFVLRVFSQLDLTVEPIPEAHCVDLNGVWLRESAGGPRRIDGQPNPGWALNPQFWLSLPANASTKQKVTLKMVLRRTDRKAGRDDKSDGTKNRVGLSIARVMPPPPENPRFRKRAQRRLAAATAAVTGEDLATVAARTGGLSGTAAFDNTVTAPAVLVPPDRRLEILKEDFCVTSDYSDAVVATTLVTVPADWMVDGMTIHPTMRLVGREGDFTLSVYSNIRLQMQELAPGRTKTVTGEWNDKNAAGCHLHPDWKKNPAFQLKPLDAVDHARVTITCSRPEEHWRGLAKQDSVGCMLGFYIVTCDKERDSKFHDGRTGMETSFVPMHTVTATFELSFVDLPEGKVYLIVPATFEPGKEGPFHLSVTMDTDFVCKLHKQ